MSDSASAKEPSLTAEEIQAAVVSRLKRYDDLNFFERFAMFMGIAQILELQLKQLLERQFGVPIEKTERKTLGQVSRALRDHGLRSDFLLLLASVVEYRNHVAHEQANSCLPHWAPARRDLKLESWTARHTSLNSYGFSLNGRNNTMRGTRQPSNLSFHRTELARAGELNRYVALKVSAHRKER